MNWKSVDFSRLEEEVRVLATDFFPEMIHNANRLGFIADADTVLARANSKLPNGELIAEVMLSEEKYDSSLLAPDKQGGERSDMAYINFYPDYFAQGNHAFVSVRFMSYRHAVEMIRVTEGYRHRPSGS